MKKVFIGLFTLGFATFCSAQSSGKKEEVKFTPPVLKKNKPNANKGSTAKVTPPVIIKDEGVKFTPPVLKKNKPVKKNKKVKFTPPVIVKDKPAN